MLGSHLHLKQTQQLNMTAQLQQALRLLQLSQLELSLEVDNMLNSNIMLEREDESTENYSEEALARNESPASDEALVASHAAEEQYNTPEKENNTEVTEDIHLDWDGPEDTDFSGLTQSEQGDDPIDFAQAAGQSLHELLLWQLNLSPMSDLDKHLAATIIDSINTDGYLLVPLTEIYTGLLALSPDLDLDEVAAVLSRIQQFDPPGVGARSLTECLLIQLNQLKPKPIWAETARQILLHHSELLLNLDKIKLSRRLQVTIEQLDTALTGLRHLEPRPGRQLGDTAATLITPDVLVSHDVRGFHVTLNPDIVPKIRVNREYALIAQTDNQAAGMLRQQLTEARWFVKTVQSRFDTLLKVASEIVSSQQAFFRLGDSAMKPMIMRDIAEKLELHESTISRTVSGKFIMSAQGTHELRFFFSSSVTGENDGIDASSVAIRAAIKRQIAQESPQKPLSDSKLVALLEKEGFNVARRTVAKYREMMGYASSSERKRIH